MTSRWFWIRNIAAGLLFLALAGLPARAQDTTTAPRILFPQPGQAVRGEISVLFDGIPDGGYAIIRVDGKWVQATAQNSYTLNTFPPTFASDGTHRVSVTAINASGKLAGETEVSFEVANTKIDPSVPGIVLTHFTNAERIGSPVQRYRIFAESDANIDLPTGSSGGATVSSGGATGGGGTNAPAGDAIIPAPLDWQVSALIRRMVRDVDMLDGAANIRSVIQEAAQRQRADEAGGAGAAGGAATATVASTHTGAPHKAPWGTWTAAPELGEYFVKMIKPSGEEINAVRKAPTMALGDLLPSFPETEVRPGSTWETDMTFVGELSTRQAINVKTPITFTSFENVRTPAGEERRTAKLESQFRLPQAVAMTIAARLAAQMGGAGGSGGAGAGGAGGAAGAPGGVAPVGAAVTAGSPGSTSDVSTASILTANTNVKRTLYFDVVARQVLRSEDEVDTYFETNGSGSGSGSTTTAGPGGTPAGAGGPSITPANGAPGGSTDNNSAPAEPTKVRYHLSVVTWLDDSPPPATHEYTAGAGTAHSRDDAQDPSLSRVTQPGLSSLQ